MAFLNNILRIGLNNHNQAVHKKGVVCEDSIKGDDFVCEDTNNGNFVLRSQTMAMIFVCEDTNKDYFVCEDTNNGSRLKIHNQTIQNA